MLTLKIPADLSTTSYASAMSLYLDTWAAYPVMLLVGTENVVRAEEVIRESEQKVTIICVPVFPRDAWILCGVCDVFYCSGS